VSDLYSLGVILYELASGTRPFKGDNLAAIFHAITSETPKKPHELNPGFPPALSEIIMKCLNKDPGSRFADGRELSDALRAFLKSQEPALVPAAQEKKKPVALIFTAAVAALIVAAGIFGLPPRRGPGCPHG
jgi:serine/threonine-protein kinase